MSDPSIIATADDAISTKYAAVQAKYYQDPFLSPFVTSARQCQPIIKRGTHARVVCTTRVIEAFIARHEKPCIVVLGAGKDTTFFRYSAGLLDVKPTEGASSVQWHEVDHPTVIDTKARVIQQQKRTFKSQVDRHASGAGFVVTTTANKDSACKCHLIGHDLRESPSELLNKLSHLSPSEDSILFVMECVQMYLLESSTVALWKHLRESCPRAVLALYDPILGESSSFGNVMEQHLLRTNKVSLDSSLCHTRTLPQHLTKLVDTCGWHQAIGCDMWWAYQTMLTDEQRQHANRCEFLDEIEEWQMIMQHYCIVVACATDAADTELCRAGSLLGLDARRSVVKTNSN